VTPLPFLNISDPSSIYIEVTGAVNGKRKRISNVRWLTVLLVNFLPSFLWKFLKAFNPPPFGISEKIKDGTK
jgi:hypothetical protein